MNSFWSLLHRHSSCPLHKASSPCFGWTDAVCNHLLAQGQESICTSSGGSLTNWELLFWCWVFYHIKWYSDNMPSHQALEGGAVQESREGRVSKFQSAKRRKWHRAFVVSLVRLLGIKFIITKSHPKFTNRDAPTRSACCCPSASFPSSRASLPLPKISDFWASM